MGWICVGDGLPVERGGCSCEMQLWCSRHQITEDCEFGRWMTDCGFPSSAVSGGEEWALDLHTTEGFWFSWSSASAPDHRYVSSVRLELCGNRDPQTDCHRAHTQTDTQTNIHWLAGFYFSSILRNATRFLLGKSFYTMCAVEVTNDIKERVEDNTSCQPRSGLPCPLSLPSRQNPQH